MGKRRKFTSISDMPEVSDEEYRRLAAEATAKMRSEARKQLPRSEWRKMSVESSVVSEEEYAKLSESARVHMRENVKPNRRQRLAKVAESALTDVSPEEYRRLSTEMVTRSERLGERQERIMTLVRGLINPITFAILLFIGICVYFLLQNQHISIF